MSAPTGQAPPRPRDPLKDPEPGEVFVTKLGLWRRVLEVGAGVTFDWPHWPEVGTRTATRGAWRAWASAHGVLFQSALSPQLPGVPHPFDPAHGGGFARRAVAHRDGKPENVLTTSGCAPIPPQEHSAIGETASQATPAPRAAAHRPSDRDLRAMGAIEQGERESTDGWDRSPRARRLERSGLTWPQWRGAVPSLLKAGRVERAEGNSVAGEVDPLRLTGLGRTDLRASAGTPPAQVQHTPQHRSSTPLGSVTSSLERTATAREPTKTVQPAQGGVLTVECPALDRIADMLGLLLQAHVERCGCGRVKEPAKRRGDGARFMRCPAWKTCEHARAKAPPASSDEPSGPRVSPLRSDQARAERLAARAQALAERMATG